MTTGSTRAELHVGRLEWQTTPSIPATQKILDTKGAVDRFMRKYDGQASTVGTPQA